MIRVKGVVEKERVRGWDLEKESVVLGVIRVRERGRGDCLRILKER